MLRKVVGRFMKVVFFKQRANNKAPAYEFIKKLHAKDRLRIFGCLQSLAELGFDSPRVQFRQIRGKLWEIKIKTSEFGFRAFYVVLKSRLIVILHAFKKKSQKTPYREIAIAEKRMREVYENETLYNA